MAGDDEAFLDCFHSSKDKFAVPFKVEAGVTRSEKSSLEATTAAVPGRGLGGTDGGLGERLLNVSLNAEGPPNPVPLNESPNPPVVPAAVETALSGADVLVPSLGHPVPLFASHSPAPLEDSATIRSGPVVMTVAGFEGRPRRIGEIVSARLGPSALDGTGEEEMTDEYAEEGLVEEDVVGFVPAYF